MNSLRIRCQLYLYNITSWHCTSDCCISTHILTKRMTSRIWTWLLDTIFQLTSSRRGWLLLLCSVLLIVTFQLTSSRRGWLTFSVDETVILLFQLTSSRRGWRISEMYDRYRNNISTHILTKRMTGTLDEEDETRWISTHILTKRMTKLNRRGLGCELFQLTSSRRGWRGV